MRGPAFAIAAAALIVLCGSPASAGRKKPASDPLATALAGRVAGKPTDCIDPQFSDGPQVIDDHTLIYRQGRRIWRNDLPAACPSLNPQSTLIISRWGGQLCRNDTFRTIETGSTIPSGICRFGDFTPYDRPKGVK